MAQNFNVTHKRDRVTVSVDADTISATTSAGQWIFDRHTQLPVSFETPGRKSILIHYAVDKQLAASHGLGAISAVDDNGIAVGRPMNGTGAIPAILEAIQKASGLPKFPDDAKDIIPDLFRNIGQPVPQRSGP